MKLEEQEETNKTLSEVNSVLRAQLESAVRGNETLARDVQRIGEEHARQRKDQEERVSYFFSLLSVYDYALSIQ